MWERCHSFVSGQVDAQPDSGSTQMCRVRLNFTAIQGQGTLKRYDNQSVSSGGARSPPNSGSLSGSHFFELSSPHDHAPAPKVEEIDCATPLS